MPSSFQHLRLRRAAHNPIISGLRGIWRPPLSMPCNPSRVSEDHFKFHVSWTDMKSETTQESNNLRLAAVCKSFLMLDRDAAHADSSTATIFSTVLCRNLHWMPDGTNGPDMGNAEDWVPNSQGHSQPESSPWFSSFYHFWVYPQGRANKGGVGADMERHPESSAAPWEFSP